MREVTFELKVDEELEFFDFENVTEYIRAYLGNKRNFLGRITSTLVQYLLQSSKKFDDAYFFLQADNEDIFSNSTGLEVIDDVEEADIDLQLTPLYDFLMERFDFAYPYNLYDYTFVTRKPRYKPQIFGLFQAFSSFTWIAVVLALMVMTLVYYYVTTRKKKIAFQEISLHVFAVFLRQNAVLNPSSVAEKLLFWFWVLGAMFLCLAYESVFLSFLALPPVNEIRNINQLAAAVRRGEYHCVTLPGQDISFSLTASKVENLRIIGRDIQENALRRSDLLRDFFQGSGDHNVALLIHTYQIEYYSVGGIYPSDDRFEQVIPAMLIRKGFCCKKLIDTFVHRLMASGLYFKYESDATFLNRLLRLLTHVESEAGERKITLTDLAPAFLFLLTGYFLSGLTLIGEIWQNRRKRTRCSKIKRKRKVIIHKEHSR